MLLQAVPRRREQAAMEALSGSASLDDFVAKIEATDWAGCDARAFARAATVKLVTLSKAATLQWRIYKPGSTASSGVYYCAFCYGA